MKYPIDFTEMGEMRFTVFHYTGSLTLSQTVYWAIDKNIVLSLHLANGYLKNDIYGIRSDEELK